MSLLMEREHELIVVGAGPAGLAAALAAHRAGVRDILLLERDREPGGILNQCIHNGFGLHYFKEELTGPEYALRFIRQLSGTGIRLLCDTMVLSVNPDLTVHAVSPAEGYRILRAKTVILAMGCRERPRGAIGIPGDRPSGVLTAGTAQRYINMEGYQVGKRAVILGSGDIGLIMARRLTLEGAKVLCCVELMPYSSGLSRNISQCLDDFGIPLLLSHTVTRITGRRRLESVTVSAVDESRRPIPGTEQVFDCDTLLLSVGLIPENELSQKAGVEMDSHTRGPVVNERMETSVPGLFACGNVAHVHDLADFVTLEAQRAGEAAAERILGGTAPEGDCLSVVPGEGAGYVLPQKLCRTEANAKSVPLFFRVSRVYKNARASLYCGERQLYRSSPAHRAPGELQRLAVPAKALEGLDGKLELRIEEEPS